MNNNFEKQVSRQGDQFELKPSNGVWNRIEAELDKKQRRRIAGWWWATPLLLLLAGGLYWFLGTPKNFNEPNAIVKNNAPNTSITSTEEQHNQPRPEKVGVKPELDRPTSKTLVISPSKPEFNPKKRKEQIIDKKFNHHAAKVQPSGLIMQQGASSQSSYSKTNTSNPGDLTSTPPTHRSDDIKAVSQPPLETNIFQKNRQSLSHTSLATSDTQKSNHVANAPHPLGPELAIFPEQQQANNISEPLKIADPATVRDLISANNLAQPDSAISNPVIPQGNTSLKIKKGWWTASLAIGASNLTQNNSLFKAFQPANREFVMDNSLGNTNNTSIPTTIKANKQGLAFEAALAYQLPLKKRWLWNSSFVYQYLSIRQYSGARKDSTVYAQERAGFSNSMLKNNSSNYFYYPGSNVNHRGQNHRLRLQSNLVYQLISRKKKLGLGVGLYAAYNLSHQYLVMDYQNRRLIPSANKQRPINAGAALQLLFTTPKKHQYSLQYLTDFTAAHPAYGTKKYYWRSLQLTYSFPLK